MPFPHMLYVREEDEFQGGNEGPSWARVCGTPWEEMLALMITKVLRISESRMWARTPPSSGACRSIISLSYGEWWAQSLVVIVVLPRAPRPLKRQDTGKTQHHWHLPLLYALWVFYIFPCIKYIQDPKGLVLENGMQIR